VQKYLIRFAATVEREVEVPDGLSWSEAYCWVQRQIGWHEIAYSAAATVEIDTSRTVDFETRAK
jgi:hypothetical protein